MCQLFCIYIATGDKCVKSPFVAAIESFSSAHDFFLLSNAQAREYSEGRCDNRVYGEQ